MKNKTFSRTLFVAVALLTCIFLFGCSDNDTNIIEDEVVSTTSNVSDEETDSFESVERMKIVTSIFPIYDWVSVILGDEIENVTIYGLFDAAEDIEYIAEADVLIYVGGESEAWITEALVATDNENLIIVNLFDILGDSIKTLEILDCMTSTEDEYENDEFIWLSLINAQIICDAIADALMTADEDYAEIYSANVLEYNESLAALSDGYISVAETATYNTLLVADNFPFAYLVDDYGLSYYAAFTGSSIETNASFETIMFLAIKIDELGLETILVTESSDKTVADSVSINTYMADQKILVLDSMQSTTLSDWAAGSSYLSVMKSNLDILATALGGVYYFEEEVVNDEEFDDEEIVEEDEDEEEDTGEIEMIDAPNLIEEAEIVHQTIIDGEVVFEFDANGIKWVYNTGDLDYEDGYTRYNRPNGTVNEETGMVWLFGGTKVRWVSQAEYQQYLDNIELSKQPPNTL